MNADRVVQIEHRLRHVFTPEYVEVRDDSAQHIGHSGARDGRGHFQVLVVTADFRGQSLLARHRLVYGALADLMQTDIHALTIKALTPDEWDSTAP